MKKEHEIAKIEKEKMRYVQLLATHYQRVEELDIGEERDAVVRQILLCRNEIFKINKELVKLKTDQ